MLEMPASYRNATEDERVFRCNGCGTKGLGGWIVPDTLYGLSITEACDIHDWMYFEGKTSEDKREADKMFLRNMEKIINRKTGLWAMILRPFRMRRARLYYLSVYNFGGPAFWSGK